MATGPTPQRRWRAACPNCGAPVHFASAASASAVCSFCHSTLLRDGDALRRVGTSAELFDDHSPLQLGAAGYHQGVAFTLVGRLQYGTEGGTWNEWHALFEHGADTPKSGWLSEDNGAYVLAFDAPLPADAPPGVSLQPGQRCVVGGQAWNVASVVRARLIAAQGELPSPPRLEGGFTVIDLRNQQGEVATLDDAQPPHWHWSVGRSVALSALALSGLREASDKTLAGRSIECPSCGAALAITLASTQSISCPQCKAVIDLSQSVGAELHHHAQNVAGAGGLAPQIALGSTGVLSLGGEALPWQVVGYQVRCDLPDDGDDEPTCWREYLLYNRQQGFAFLVDADDGWSWVKPLTGVPQVRGNQATWQGDHYRQRYRYRASVTWVQGEFYWQVKRGEVTEVTDYDGTGAARRKRLSCEQTDGEVTWSAGETLDAASLADAFRIAPLAPLAHAALQRDAAPLAGAKGTSRTALVIFVAAVLLMVLLTRCSRDDCDEARNTFGEASAEFRQCERNRAAGGLRPGGGSFGGYSSGGGHK